MWGGFGGGLGGGGYGARRFEEQYHCYSVSVADKAHLEVRSWIAAAVAVASFGVFVTDLLTHLYSSFEIYLSTKTLASIQFFF